MKASGCEVELSRNRFTRLRLARLIVEGRTPTAAAKMFMVATKPPANGPTATAAKARPG